MMNTLDLLTTFFRRENNVNPCYGILTGFTDLLNTFFQRENNVNPCYGITRNKRRIAKQRS